MTDQALTPSPLPQGLMTRKPLADIIAEGEGHALGKTLGPVSLTALGIGCIIGAGIFVLTGTAAARYAGPGIMLSFVIGGIACAFVGLCYAELAALAARRRQHLHLYLRHARRDFCLDHRLGPDPRIRHGRLDRGGRLVGLHLVAAAQFRDHRPAPNMPRRRGRRSSCRMEPRSTASSTFPRPSSSSR